MKVNRVVANIASADRAKAHAFYHDILGLDLVMDLGWIKTYGSGAKMTVQVSFASAGGAGTTVPDLSIEVDNLDAALKKFQKARVAIEYGPVTEPWGVRRFLCAIHSGSW